MQNYDLLTKEVCKLGFFPICFDIAKVESLVLNSQTRSDEGFIKSEAQNFFYFSAKNRLISKLPPKNLCLDFLVCHFKNKLKS